MNKFFRYKIFWRAAGILGCFFFFSCENDQRIIDDLNRNKVMVEEAKDVQTYLSQSGKMKAKLWAPFMIRSQSDTIYYEFPRSLHVNFFDSTGKTDSHLDALYGKYFENLNKVYLRDSVVVFNAQGDTLRSPDLWWDQSTQKFYTDKVVRIKRRSGDSFNGKGFDARQDLSEINIRQLTGMFNVPDSMRAQ